MATRIRATKTSGRPAAAGSITLKQARHGLAASIPGDGGIEGGTRPEPASPKLTHVDSDGRPTMVDVGAKAVTRRMAVAEVVVRFPAEVAKTLRKQGLRSAKGPVIDTAIIAGTMAVKRTHDLIPFCHPLPIENCRIDAEFVSKKELRIRCTVALTHKTGVEMEALTGASVAALTVYDMCKALSHEIVIDGLHLVEKSGGKRRVKKGRAVG